MHFREPARKLLNTDELIQHLEIALPKPGVRGSSPLRDASNNNDLIVKTTVQKLQYFLGYHQGNDRVTRHPQTLVSIN
jgi:hypothetical protein